jgi:SpoVK/Ycf46/Vps4 family AAA+-type ATPase
VCQEAALLALEEDIELSNKEDVNAIKVKREHFMKALSTCVRRISQEMKLFYDEFRHNSGLQSV